MLANRGALGGSGLVFNSLCKAFTGHKYGLSIQGICMMWCDL